MTNRLQRHSAGAGTNNKSYHWPQISQPSLHKTAGWELGQSQLILDQYSQALRESEGMHLLFVACVMWPQMGVPYSFCQTTLKAEPPGRTTPLYKKKKRKYCIFKFHRPCVLWPCRAPLLCHASLPHHSNRLADISNGLSCCEVKCYKLQIITKTNILKLNQQHFHLIHSSVGGQSLVFCLLNVNFVLSSSQLWTNQSSIDRWPNKPITSLILCKGVKI